MKKNEMIAISQSPSYLFDNKESENNQWSFFITSSNTHCWIKKDLNTWEKLGIQSLCLERSVGWTYYFKENNYYIKSLDIPIMSEAYFILETGLKIRLKPITLSQEELDNRDISKLEPLDSTTIPKTRQEAQQRLVLAEKKQEISKEIRTIETIIDLLYRSVKNIQRLKNPNESSIELLNHEINEYEKNKKALDEKKYLLEHPTEESAQTVATMKI